MYTIVTHTIKEEHFNHPVLAEKGMAINHSKGYPSNGNGATNGNLNVAMAGLRSRSSNVMDCDTDSGNLVVKMPLDYEWTGQDYWGDYRAWGDLTVQGSATISGDLNVEGTINGRGTVNDVMVLEAEPSGNTWAGLPGDLARTSSHMYLCVENDKWIRWSVQDSW
jgi:hypothetical protein